MTNHGVNDSDHGPPLRSMLFVPGDSEKKLAASARVPADALILDLEDSVDPARKAAARELVAAFLERRTTGAVWVRVNAVDDPEHELDLASIVPARPDGIVLPKVRSPDDVTALAGRLEPLERRAGVARGATRILPIATETAAGVFALGGYARCGPRLAALTWGAEDLAVALGAAANVDEHGEWLPPYQLARSLCLLAAAAAGVPALDTVCLDLRDEERLARQAAAARRDGFAGKLAIHPAQVDVLNRTFRPQGDEIAAAQRIVAAFAAAPGAGVVALDGRMVDRPHLMRARRTLDVAAALAARDGAQPPSPEPQRRGG
jgi:citrate lyase subunit beta/citryl-CoA lyase